MTPYEAYRHKANIAALLKEQKQLCGFAVGERVKFLPRDEWHRVVKITREELSIPILTGTWLDISYRNIYFWYITTIAEGVEPDELSVYPEYESDKAKTLYEPTGEVSISNPCIYETRPYSRKFKKWGW